MGLKENVIIGKLIPAGTGLARFRHIAVEPTDEAKAQMYQVPGYDELDFSGFGQTGEIGRASCRERADVFDEGGTLEHQASREKENARSTGESRHQMAHVAR